MYGVYFVLVLVVQPSPFTDRTLVDRFTHSWGRTEEPPRAMFSTSHEQLTLSTGPIRDEVCPARWLCCCLVSYRKEQWCVVVSATHRGRLIHLAHGDTNMSEKHKVRFPILVFGVHWPAGNARHHYPHTISASTVRDWANTVLGAYALKVNNLHTSTSYVLFY